MPSMLNATNVNADGKIKSKRNRKSHVLHSKVIEARSGHKSGDYHMSTNPMKKRSLNVEMRNMESQQAASVLYNTGRAIDVKDQETTSANRELTTHGSKRKKGRHGLRRCMYAWLVQAKRNPGVEILLYMTFFIVLLAFTQDVKGSNSTYFFASLVEDVIVFEEFDSSASHIRKDFTDVAEAAEFWDFIEGPFYNAIWGNHDGDCRANNLLDSDDCSSRRAKIYYSDFALLGIRFKQNRVRRYSLGEKDSPVEAPPSWIKNLSPDAHNAMQEQGVYPEYSFADQDKQSPFNLTGPISPIVDECFEFKARKFDWTTTGKIYPFFYSPSGYSCFLNTNSTEFGEASKWLRGLKESRWLDQGTRMILIDITLYSANIDSFLFFRIGIEQAPTGGLLSFWDSYSVSLPEQTPLYTLALRGALMFLCFIFFVQEISEWCHHGCKYYCSSFWNVLELINLSLFFAYSTLMLFAEFVLEHEKDTENFDIFAVGLLKITGDSFLSVNMVFSVLKIFKYIKVSRRMQLMLNTFYDARWALSALLVLVMVFLVGFSMAFFIAFGHRIEGFRSFSKSFVTLFFSLLDGFEEAKELERVNWFLGPLLYLSFQVFISFVLLSLLIAIIEDSFNTAQEELKNNQGQDALVVAMRTQVGRVWRGAKIAGHGVAKRAKNVPGVKMVAGRLSKLKQRSRSSRGLASFTGVAKSAMEKETIGNLKNEKANGQGDNKQSKNQIGKESRQFLKKVIESGKGEKASSTSVARKFDSKRQRRQSQKFEKQRVPPIKGKTL